MKKEPINLFLNPPWKSLAGGLVMMGLSACVLLRFSELGGAHAEHACRVSLKLGAAVGLLGFYPVLVSIGGSGWGVMSGALLGGAVRVAIGAIGFVLITIFTQTHTLWLLVYSGAVYAVMLWADTMMAIGLAERSWWHEDEPCVKQSYWKSISG